MKTVTFCGHSEVYLSETKEKQLYEEIEKLIQQGAEEFLLGDYGKFDRLCARTVKSLKTVYPHIKSVIVTPYIDREYDEDLYDCSEYPPLEDTPKKYAIVKRNQYMVNKSDVVIAYVEYSWGGAAKTLEYANKKNKIIINLAK